MITEHYWQNTDIRKILITTWQFVFSLPYPHQPWHPWTIPISSVFPQSHIFVDLWSFWLLLLRTSWSKSFLRWNVPNESNCSSRGEGSMEHFYLLCFSLHSSNGVCYLHNSTMLLTEVWFMICWSRIYEPLKSSRLLSAELSLASHPILPML